MLLGQRAAVAALDERQHVAADHEHRDQQRDLGGEEERVLQPEGAAEQRGRGGEHAQRDEAAHAQAPPGRARVLARRCGRSGRVRGAASSCLSSHLLIPHRPARPRRLIRIGAAPTRPRDRSAGTPRAEAWRRRDVLLKQPLGAAESNDRAPPLSPEIRTAGTMTQALRQRASTRHLPAAARPRRAALAGLEGDPVAAPARGARRDRARRARHGAGLPRSAVARSRACAAAETDAAAARAARAPRAPSRRCSPRRPTATTRPCAACARRWIGACASAPRPHPRPARRGAARRLTRARASRRAAPPEAIAYACAPCPRASTCNHTRPTPTARSPPSEVVARAADAGVELLALSDHDTISRRLRGRRGGRASSASRSCRRSRSPPSTTARATPRELHILGYGIDHTGPPMTSRLEEFLADREKRTLRMRDALREVGFDLDEAEIEQRIAAGKPIGRPHLAGAVLARPANAERLKDEEIDDVGSLIRGYLIEGKPAFRLRETPTVGEAIEAIHEAGGVAIWAHPFWDISDPDEVLDSLERFRDARHRRRRGLLHHPRRAADAAAERPRGGARTCSRPARPTSTARRTASSTLHGVRDLRHRAEPRPDLLDRQGSAHGRPRESPNRCDRRAMQRLAAAARRRAPRAPAPPRRSRQAEAGRADQLDRARAARSARARAASCLELLARSTAWTSSARRRAPGTARRAATARPGAAPARASAVRARRSARRRASAPSRSWRLRSLAGISSSSPVERAAAASSPARAAGRARRLQQRAPRPLGRVARRAPRGRSPRRPRAERAPVLAGQPRARAPRRRAPAARRRARARAPTPSERSRPRSAPAGSGSKRTCWQREAIVGSTSSRAVGQQHQVRERRRLLERLQQPVGGLVVHRLGALDHEHPPRRTRTASCSPPRRPAPRCRRRASRRRPTARTQVRSGWLSRRTRSATVAGLLRALGQQRRGERARERALAGARRAVEQIGVRRRLRPRAAPGRARRARADGARRRASAVVARDASDAPDAARQPSETATVPRVAAGRLITIEGHRRRRQDDARRGARATRCASAALDVELLREPGGVDALRAHPRAARQGPGARRRAARRGAALRGRARPARRRSCSRRCSATARSCCSTASSTPRWPTRARAAGSGVEQVRAINDFATGGLAPDRTLLLRISPRAAGRASQAERPRRPTGSSARPSGFFEDDRRRLRRSSRDAEPERFARARRRARRPSAVLAAALDALGRPAAAAPRLGIARRVKRTPRSLHRERRRSPLVRRAALSPSRRARRSAPQPATAATPPVTPRRRRRRPGARAAGRDEHPRPRRRAPAATTPAASTAGGHDRRRPPRHGNARRSRDHDAHALGRRHRRSRPTSADGHARRPRTAVLEGRRRRSRGWAILAAVIGALLVLGVRRLGRLPLRRLRTALARSRCATRSPRRATAPRRRGPNSPTGPGSGTSRSARPERLKRRSERLRRPGSRGPPGYNGR